MPDVISVTDFIKETWDDYNSPTASNFVSLLSQCRNTINSLDEVYIRDYAYLANCSYFELLLLRSNGWLELRFSKQLSSWYTFHFRFWMDTERVQERFGSHLKLCTALAKVSHEMKVFWLKSTIIVAFAVVCRDVAV